MLAGVAAFKIKKKDTKKTLFFRKKKWLHPLLTISQWKKTRSQDHFWELKVYLLTDLQFFVAFLRLLENQKDDESALFPGGVSVKFGITC